MKLKKIAALLAVAGISAPAFATNGMNMEGYGPVATGMGGASFAYDNGNGGMINNPATLGFMKSGTSRLDIAIGGLHPDVRTTPAAGGSAKDSDGDAYFMPAFGYVRKDGQLAWGVGMMAQGGMGTDYSNGNFWGTLTSSGDMNGVTGPGGAPAAGDFAAGQALRNMSEVGVGRLMFPLSYQVNDAFNIGGSIDYVWAGMDIKWLIDGAHFGGMMMPGGSTYGSATGTMVTAFQGSMAPNPGCGGNPCFDQMTWGYFDFEKSNTYRQAATGNGWAANIGFTYKASPTLTIGGVYHAKTDISDMKTNNNAMANFNVNLAGTYQTIPVSGKVTVRDFQWPETYGFGIAYQANPQWLFAADYKRINWAKVMQSFKMSFDANAVQADPRAAGFAGTQLNFVFNQNWKDQNVLMLGASFRYSDPLTLRFGLNLASDPVPDEYMSPLFPATIKNHVTFGFGYGFDKVSSIDFSLAHAPKVSATNNWGAGGGTNQTTSHSQTNWQLMYSHRF